MLTNHPLYHPGRVCDNFDTFALVSDDGVCKLVIKLKTTSCALDPMPNKMVKECIEELLPLLTHIINLSIATPHAHHQSLHCHSSRTSSISLLPVGNFHTNGRLHL